MKTIFLKSAIVLLSMLLFIGSLNIKAFANTEENVKATGGATFESEVTVDDETDDLDSLDLSEELPDELTEEQVAELEKQGLVESETYDSSAVSNKDVIKATSSQMTIMKGGLGFKLPPKNPVVKTIKGKKYVKQTTKNSEKFIVIRNGNLADLSHPISKISFNKNGFPIFKPKAQIDLLNEDIKKSNAAQFKQANKLLWLKMQTDTNLRFSFTTAERNLIKQGTTPPNYTWHHHEIRGRMQLVDKKKHKETGHTGGKAIWGTL